MIYSRIQRPEDHYLLGIEHILDVYRGVPNKFLLGEPRYKFWEYGLVLKFLLDHKIYRVLDVGNGRDVLYTLILKLHGIELLQISSENFLTLPINSQKFDCVTCLGTLDIITKKAITRNKLLKHVRRNGYLIITTEPTVSNTMTENDLFDLSMILEKNGFEIYGLSEDYFVVDYPPTTNKLRSLVFKRVNV